MKHAYLFYLFITFSIGLISLGIVTLLYVKTREAVIRYYLFFYSAFSLLSASTVWLSYIYTNIPWLNSELLEYVPETFASLVMFTTPLFIHFLLSVPNVRLKNIILGGIALLVFLQRPIILKYVIKDYMTISQASIYVTHILFIGVFLYTALVGLYASRKTQEQSRKTLAQIFSVFLLVSLPAIIIDSIAEEEQTFQLIPFCYAILSVFFAYYFVKLYGHFPQPPQGLPETLSVETLCQEYHLSPREMEIVHLILQGYNNQKIGDTLFISVSTVKKHITNIYQKLDIKGRYELIALFRNASIDCCTDKTDDSEH